MAFKLTDAFPAPTSRKIYGRPDWSLFLGSGTDTSAFRGKPRGVRVDARDHDRKFALTLGDDNRVIRFRGVLKDLVKREPIRRLILVNLSEIVARMRIAADEHAIDLESFWQEGW